MVLSGTYWYIVVHNGAQVKYSCSERCVNLLTGCHSCWLVNLNRSFSLADGVVFMVTTGLCTGGRGIALQAGTSLVLFPKVSLQFFIDIILPIAL